MCSKYLEYTLWMLVYVAFPPNYVQRDRLLSLFGTIPVAIRGMYIQAVLL